ncbi:MAG: NERD domain-containing protein [Rhodocyclales bacterium]|nr:NERD domain-containing protein [Rhodocyclales bacterium]
MIYKELDAFSGDDKFARAGRAAEERMAFYLKRFFAADPELLVLNGIRLEHADDAAQVDHLIIHPYGLVIVESKSVHGKIQIKDDGQWIRWFNGNQSKGIASPLTQARMQAQFFRECLGIASKQPAIFRDIPIDILVAISDDGVIVWPKSGPVDGVCKADQIPEKITALRAERAKSGGVSLSAINREKIAEFLKVKNTPLYPVATSAVEAQVAEPPPPPMLDEPIAEALPSAASVAKCRHCGSEELEIRYGFSYYFACKACKKSTPIEPVCPVCEKAARLRKQKQEFFIDCTEGHSSLYFVNC